MKFLKDSSFDYRQINSIVNTLLEKQLLVKKDWENFIDAFYSHFDDIDFGWRGEFFGKMMRGSSLIYKYKNDDSLYKLLEYATRKVLASQDELGRISSYSIDKEFQGWDIWNRKYVITGLIHFLDICKDTELKQQIIESLRKHIDYIIFKIGEDKIDITTTSNFWEGINSSSILETIVAFYNIVKEQKYLDFATYIIKRGGTYSQNVVQLAYEDKIPPFQYKITKAYELISFFEGVLEYGLTTNDDYYLTAAKNFVKQIKNTDLTIIGSCGCTHEYFDNSTITQTNYTENIMQETCVTVTWIRLNTKLLMYTDDISYFENIESSFYNGLLGAINTENCPLYEQVNKEMKEAKLVDSYSPLYCGSRGKAIGGFKTFKDGSYYGCCIAIVSAGIALLPLTSIMHYKDGYIFNNYLHGNINDGKLNIFLSSSYLSKGQINVNFYDDFDEPLYFRVPSWCKKVTVLVNRKERNVQGNLISIHEHLHKGSIIQINFQKSLDILEINHKVCFIYSPIVLAFDEQKQKDIDINNIIIDGNEISYRHVAVYKNELLRIAIFNKEQKLILSDYASCGKKYRIENNRISTWFKKYNFYGANSLSVAPINEQFKDIKDQRHLYDLLSSLWCKETCAPRMQNDWSKENMTLGQCSITSFLVQDIFGGDVYGVKLNDGNYHCFNKINDVIFDLTSEQFKSEILDYSLLFKQDRNIHFAKEEKYKRYQMLKNKLITLL